MNSVIILLFSFIQKNFFYRIIGFLASTIYLIFLISEDTIERYYLIIAIIAIYTLFLLSYKRIEK
jgi:hypothetical protein